MSEMSNSNETTTIKARTLQLYDKLPQLKMVRKMECAKWDDVNHRWRIERRFDLYPEIVAIRDEIIQLNYKFFGYIASNKFVNNRYIEYEDKFQSVVTNFCNCWWWYKWKGDYSHKGYRQDLAFSVFFKPRISEMLEREFDEVKYSVRRSLCIEVAEQLVPKKHWTEVTLEDLNDPHVKLPIEKINSLKAIFGSMYIGDIADHEAYLESDNKWVSKYDDELDVKFDSWDELLIYCMVEEEKALSDEDLQRISETYNIGQMVAEQHPDKYTFEDLTEDDFIRIGFFTLKARLPIAEESLKSDLLHNLSLKHTFNE